MRVYDGIGGYRRVYKVHIRRSDTGFGIWDLARKLDTMAKFGPFGQNLDFFGTILGPFWDFVVILMILP